MKKLLLAIITLSTLTTFAANWPENFDWNCQDATTIDGWITYMTENKDPGKIIILNSMKELIGKDQTNLSYEELKAIIIKNLKVISPKATIIQINRNNAIPQMIRTIKRFNNFVSSVITDPDFADNNYVISVYYNKSWIDGRYLVEAAEWRKITFERNMINPNINTKLSVLTSLMDRYEKEQLKFTKEQVKADMELVKRIVYPKLSTNEKFKPIAVKAELLLKSVQ